MLTEKDYCDYETCVALMEIGFRGFGHFYYEKDSSKLKATSEFLTVRTAKALGHTLAISLYDAQKFLREEKSIYVTVGCPLIMNEGLGWSYEVCDKPWNGHSDDDCVKASGGAYDSYEEALSEGLRTAIKILKEK